MAAVVFNIEQSHPRDFPIFLMSTFDVFLFQRRKKRDTKRSAPVLVRFSSSHELLQYIKPFCILVFIYMYIRQEGIRFFSPSFHRILVSSGDISMAVLHTVFFDYYFQRHWILELCPNWFFFSLFLLLFLLRGGREEDPMNNRIDICQSVCALFGCNRRPRP